MTRPEWLVLFMSIILAPLWLAFLCGRVAWDISSGVKSALEEMLVEPEE